MTDYVNAFGIAVGEQVLRYGDFEPLRPLLDDVNSADRRRKAAGKRALSGALGAMASAVELAARSGVKFSGPAVPTAGAVTYAFEVGGQALSDAAQRLVDVVHSMHSCAELRPWMRGLTATPATTRETPPAPTPVSVVSMPPRRSVTHIERDAVGDIARTEQIEADF